VVSDWRACGQWHAADTLVLALPSNAFHRAIEAGPGCVRYKQIWNGSPAARPTGRKLVSFGRNGDRGAGVGLDLTTSAISVTDGWPGANESSAVGWSQGLRRTQAGGPTGAV